MMMLLYAAIGIGFYFGSLLRRTQKEYRELKKISVLIAVQIICVFFWPIMLVRGYVEYKIAHKDNV